MNIKEEKSIQRLFDIIFRKRQSVGHGESEAEFKTNDGFFSYAEQVSEVITRDQEIKASKQDNQNNLLDHQNTIGEEFKNKKQYSLGHAESQVEFKNKDGIFSDAEQVYEVIMRDQKHQIDPEVLQMEAETDRACVLKQIGNIPEKNNEKDVQGRKRKMSRIPVERLSTDQKLNMALDDIVKQTHKSTLKHHNARSGSTSSYHSALKDNCSPSYHTPSKGGTYSKTPESKGSPLSVYRRSPKSFTPSGLNLFRIVASPILQKDHGEITPRVAVYKRKLEDRETVSDVVPCTENIKVM